MSGALLIAANKPSAQPKLDGFFGLELSNASKPLDRLAKKLGVAPLTSFVSVDEEDQEMVAEFAEEAGADISGWKAEPVKWFEASDGLKTVQALLDRLNADPKAVRKGPAIVVELTELQAALTVIAKKKARWRFWIDY